MAVGHQKSGLNQHAKSSVGAIGVTQIGVMQLMPETRAEMKVGDVHQEDANSHAVIKYFRSIMDRLYGGEPMDDQKGALRPCRLQLWLGSREAAARRSRRERPQPQRSD